MFLVSAFLFIFAFHANAHSWMECSKYLGDVSKPFDWSKCDSKAKPRPIGGRNVGATFGADIGFDYRPPTGGDKPCQGDASNFASNYPTGAVEYEIGGTYTMAWPPKNHVAACGNNFIPDAFLKLHMVPYTDGQTDPNQEIFRDNQVAATFSDDPHVRGVADYKGFQNCPNFCNNRDKALCTGNFTVPAATAPGKYTFQWYWAFNGPQDLYSTCYEAQIVAKGQGDGTGFKPTTPQTPAPTTSAPIQPGETPQPTAAVTVAPPKNPGDMSFPETDAAMNACANLSKVECDSNRECSWCEMMPRNVCGSKMEIGKTCMWSPSRGNFLMTDDCDEGDYKEPYQIRYTQQCPFMCNRKGDFGYEPCGSGVFTLSLLGFIFLMIALFL